MTTLEINETHQSIISTPSASELSGADITVPQNAPFASSGVAVPNTDDAATDDVVWQAPEFRSAHSAIHDLIRDQEEWLNGVHFAAFGRLLVLLQRCFHLSELVSTDEEKNKQLMEEIANQIAARKLNIKDSTSTYSKIINVVFGTDHGLASSYRLVLDLVFD